MVEKKNIQRTLKRSRNKEKTIIMWVCQRKFFSSLHVLKYLSIVRQPLKILEWSFKMVIKFITNFLLGPSREAGDGLFKFDCFSFSSLLTLLRVPRNNHVKGFLGSPLFKSWLTPCCVMRNRRRGCQLLLAKVRMLIGRIGIYPYFFYSDIIVFFNSGQVKLNSKSN